MALNCIFINIQIVIISMDYNEMVTIISDIESIQIISILDKGNTCKKGKNSDAILQEIGRAHV